MELLYRGTRDGMSAEVFHNKCNNKGPTISLFKNEKGYIFGGYASIDWTSYGGYKSAPDSFIFTLTNMYNISPTKFPNSDTSKSIYGMTCKSDFSLKQAGEKKTATYIILPDEKTTYYSLASLFVYQNYVSLVESADYSGYCNGLLFPPL